MSNRVMKSRGMTGEYRRTKREPKPQLLAGEAEAKAACVRTAKLSLVPAIDTIPNENA
jgi:hypothetical protein